MVRDAPWQGSVVHDPVATAALPVPRKACFDIRHAWPPEIFGLAELA